MEAKFLGTTKSRKKFTSSSREKEKCVSAKNAELFERAKPSSFLPKFFTS